MAAGRSQISGFIFETDLTEDRARGKFMLEDRAMGAKKAIVFNAQ
jgi:hypothetical protein